MFAVSAEDLGVKIVDVISASGWPDRYLSVLQLTAFTQFWTAFLLSILEWNLSAVRRHTCTTQPDLNFVEIYTFLYLMGFS